MTTRRGFFATLGAALVATSAARILPADLAPPIEFTSWYSQEFVFSAAEFSERYLAPAARNIANAIDYDVLHAGVLEYRLPSDDLTTSL